MTLCFASVLWVQLMLVMIALNLWLPLPNQVRFSTDHCEKDQFYLNLDYVRISFCFQEDTFISSGLLSGYGKKGKNLKMK